MSTKRQRFRLSPFRIEAEGVEVNCVAIRSLLDDEILHIALNADELCKKAEMPRALAERVFAAVVNASGMEPQ